MFNFVSSVWISVVTLAVAVDFVICITIKYTELKNNIYVSTITNTDFITSRIFLYIFWPVILVIHILNAITQLIINSTEA